jgi:hypothetical protein
VLTERRYFQASLALPLVVPLFMGLVAFLSPSEVLDGFAAIFLFSLVLGGIPYLLFVVGILIWSRCQSVSAIRRLSYFAPLLYVMATAGLGLIALFFGASIQEVAGFVAIFSVYALLFGYLYVFIVNFVYELCFGKRFDT